MTILNDRFKNGYDNIAGFYDSVLGDSRETEKYILNKVKELFKSNHQSKPEALELGCGTGNNLLFLKISSGLQELILQQKCLRSHDTNFRNLCFTEKISGNLI